MSHPRPPVTDLERVYLLWRGRSTARWQSQLGDDAGDLLSEVWLRLSRVVGTYHHASDQATLRYIESVAEYALRDRRRTEARRSELVRTALELGARGLTTKREECPGAEEALMGEVDFVGLVAAARLTRQQRIAMIGRWRGVEREVIALMLDVNEETIREHERMGIARLRDAVKGVGE